MCLFFISLWVKLRTNIWCIQFICQSHLEPAVLDLPSHNTKEIVQIIQDDTTQKETIKRSRLLFEPMVAGGGGGVCEVVVGRERIYAPPLPT